QLQAMSPTKLLSTILKVIRRMNLPTNVGSCSVILDVVMKNSSNPSDALQLAQALPFEQELPILLVDRIVNHAFKTKIVIDTNDRFHSIFFYEICPILEIAKLIGDDEASVIFNGPSAPIDCSLRYGDSKIIQNLELTCAIDGKNDALIMELLKERGHSPAFRNIDVQGTKKNRRFGKNPSMAISRNAYLEDTLLPLLCEAIDRKIKKAQTNKHYLNAWLGVVFDDWLVPIGNAKKKRAFDPICQKALDSFLGTGMPFLKVFFVGVSRRYIFGSDCLQLR
ncbi:MAG: hypothetical protein OQJ97_16595, partial [Rhodospirillales bacterium]|nr:hypothetical protein [Rhodospirillales bacterium]